MCVCASVFIAYEQVFSHTVAAVDIKRGDMDKYHGSSVQQDSGDICPKQKAAS